MLSVVQFQANPYFRQWVKRYIGNDCLNIGLVYVRQKIKFNRYLANQTNWIFFHRNTSS